MVRILGAVELRNEIGRAVGMDLPGTLVFDYPTVTAIAIFLSSKLEKPVNELELAMPGIPLVPSNR